MPQREELPVKLFKTPAAWEKWLTAHASASGVWLQFAKKGQGMVTVTYAEALDVALCHGWIDSQLKTMDAQYYLQKFTPRKPKSLWSKINVEKAEKLIAAGRMQAGGLREVEAAKAEGRWQAAYDSASTMPVPEELAAALAKNKKAKAFFETLDKTNRYAVCWRVQTAKKPETRAARVKKLVEMLVKREKIH
jgi:uncharacterized protein YdeI (YjbR/CyaY-like superfamily)